MASLLEVSGVILSCVLLGLVFAAVQFSIVARVSLSSSAHHNAIDEQSAQRIYKIYSHIRTGAQAFLRAEYSMCLLFLGVFGGLVFLLTSRSGDSWEWAKGAYTAFCFLIGGLTSTLCGYIGMSIAVFSNARTTIGAAYDGQEGWTRSFNTAFKAGNVMGFSLVSLSLLMMTSLIAVLSTALPLDDSLSLQARMKNVETLFECLSGFGLGGSCIALFGRVGGGIYTKAADVGADLAGKVVEGIPEDDPRNPAVIADNVGDNVGDVAGMGADLFGSLAESCAAALVIGVTSPEIVTAGWAAILFPLVFSAGGIIASILTTFIATHISPVKSEEDVEKALKLQLFFSSLIATLIALPASLLCLPRQFVIGEMTEGSGHATGLGAFCCISAGLWGGCIIGFVTEYFTSHMYKPVRELAHSCETGAATNIIYGLSLGYKSTIIPVLVIATSIYASFSLAEMYGVALCALGMLGTLSTCLSIDVYGPVCDNAGGIAEMSGLPSSVRAKTDALDAAGNTTAAIGKGFAIGSASLVSLALFGGFTTRVGLWKAGINILRPITTGFLFVGAMLPYWFTAMTMRSVGTAAMEMVKEVKRQFATIPGLLEGAEGHAEPDHARCVEISTDAALREMVAPALVVILSPICVGSFFGVEAVSGLLLGALVSGVQLAISQSNTGGAWDNAKKYIEKGELKIATKDGRLEVQGKGSDVHKAAVVGDTVGDPLKDTSGPAINILMKLMAIISLVFGKFFLTLNHGRGILDISSRVLVEH